MSRFSDLLRALARVSRETGAPRSPNGASSFHLIWEFPGGAVASQGVAGPARGVRSGAPRLIEVSAVLEVLVAPQVRSLYFWALQVDFLDRRGVWGGGHAGLQWNQRYPGGTAVNWGGYAAPELGGEVLNGSLSGLPGFPDDPHTLSYAWLPKRPYRLRIRRSPEVPGAWRAEVTDLLSDSSSVIRDLFPVGGRRPTGTEDESLLSRPLVWSEVFAECDAPSVTVRWTDLQAVDETGRTVRPHLVRVNYQSVYEGGCTNTTAAEDGVGLLQVTDAVRSVPQDALLEVV